MSGRKSCWARGVIVLVCVVVSLPVLRWSRISHTKRILAEHGARFGFEYNPLRGPGYVFFGPDRYEAGSGALKDDDLAPLLPLLSALPCLANVDILRCPGITSKGALLVARGVKGLGSLSFSGSAVDDKLLAEWPVESRIEQLSVDATKVTSRGLLSLPKSSSLKYVYCSGLGLTDTEVAQIQRAHPEIQFFTRP